MLRYLYTLDYEIKLSDNSDKPAGEHCSRELKMQASLYGVGEKYGINALKTVAETKFKTIMGNCIWESSLSDTITLLDIIYTTTPQSDKGLRGPVLVWCKQSLIRLLESADFKEALARLPDLAYDLLVQGEAENRVVESKPKKAANPAACRKE